MKKISNQELKKLQKVELEMMTEFHRICKKHHLKYILAGGSCLGAVRHQGFIPWDDDIDVAMPREDYQKFLEIQEHELDSTKYYFQSLETTDCYPFIYGKIRRKDSIYAESISNIDKNMQGIWIDIFPCDHVPDNDVKMKFNFSIVVFLKILIGNKNGNRSISKSWIKSIVLKLIHLCSHIIPEKKKKKQLIKHMTKYNDQDTERVICYGGRYLLKEIFLTKHLEKRVLHKFENQKFYIPKYYDEFLTNLYGDYMTPPPKEKRCPEHLISEIKFPKGY